MKTIISYDVNIAHNFKLVEYESVFNYYIKHFFKNNNNFRLKNIDIIFIIDKNEFLQDITRLPSIYFKISSLVDNIFENNIPIKEADILISGLFNTDEKYSELFWRYNQNYDIRLIKLFRYLNNKTIPKLIELYTKDFNDFKNKMKG